MKKIFLLMALLGVIAGCSGSKVSHRGSGGRIPRIITTTDPAGTSFPPYIDVVPDLSQESIQLTKNNVESVLGSVTDNLKSKPVRDYDLVKDNYDLYVGEYLSIPLQNETGFKVVLSPKDSTYELKKESNFMLFRSIYQGEYKVDLYIDQTVNRRIAVTNLLKFKFTDAELYNIIQDTYREGNLRTLDKSVSLYNIAFPNSNSLINAHIMLLDLATDKSDASKIKSSLKFVLNKKGLNDDEKIVIINAKRVIKDINPLSSEFLVYTRNSKLNMATKDYLMSKSSLSSDEVDFFEKYLSDVDDLNAKNYLANWYINNGNNIRGSELLGKPIEKEDYSSNVDINREKFSIYFNAGRKHFKAGHYSEAVNDLKKSLGFNKKYKETAEVYELLGKANFQLNKYMDSTNYYKQAISLVKNPDKKAELYYNLATAYNKAGNKKEYKKYLTFIRQEFSKTVWAKKSVEELQKIK